VALARIWSGESFNISRTLHDFLLKYGDVLDHPSLEEYEEYITPGSVEDLLTSVLISTLQVVFFSSPEDHDRASFVDEYDAPTNTCLASALSMGDNSLERRRGRIFVNFFGEGVNPWGSTGLRDVGLGNRSP
jgi:hypothetical protein